MPENPLLNQFGTPFNAVPFDKIRTEHFLPAFQSLIAENRPKIDSIAESSELPTFSNTVEAIETFNYELKRLEEIFYNLNAAETNPVMQQVAQEISPMLTSYYNDITLNDPLFIRIKTLKDNPEIYEALNGEQRKLLDETYKTFIRNGANLTPEAKEEYRVNTEELARLSLKFDENLLAETNSWHLHITGEGELSGLPDFVREAAAAEAKTRNLNGWVFTLKAPSFTPFMKYADNRLLREQMYRAYSARCFNNNDRDNREIIRRIVELRLKIAQILGYPDYASYVLDDRMAQNPQSVNQFLDELLQACRPFAEKEFNEISEYARSKGAGFGIERWDWAYYSEKLKNERFSVTEEMTRPYFQLERVEAGIFDLANRLYGISFIADNSIPVYHPDVRTFRVIDRDGSFLALLYTDYFPREGKQGGAWMTNYMEQYRENGTDVRPHVSLVMNFSKPSGTKPSLLTYEEMRTLLHEFGHGLHSIFSRCTYMSLSGTNVYRDFVELPSQIMENWAEQKEWLAGIAVHFETGEKMPDDMLENILKSRRFNSGYAFIRQLSFGLNDMAWHTLNADLQKPVEVFEAEAMSRAEVLPSVPGTCVSTGFHHIFGGGYAAGYYGYKWAEVLDADAFELFLEKGIFDKEVAKSFRDHILSRGGTEDPMEIYKRFRGREPSVEPLLRRSLVQM